MLLEETYKGFVRNGALLNDEKKNNSRISIFESFLRNLYNSDKMFWAATNQYYKHLTNKEDFGWNSRGYFLRNMKKKQKKEI